MHFCAGKLKMINLKLPTKGHYYVKQLAVTLLEVFPTGKTLTLHAQINSIQTSRTTSSVKLLTVVTLTLHYC